MSLWYLVLGGISVAAVAIATYLDFRGKVYLYTRVYPPPPTNEFVDMTDEYTMPGPK